MQAKAPGSRAVLRQEVGQRPARRRALRQQPVPRTLRVDEQILALDLDGAGAHGPNTASHDPGWSPKTGAYKSRQATGHGRLISHT
jgi:hypothetical protein